MGNDFLSWKYIWIDFCYKNQEANYFFYKSALEMIFTIKKH